MGTNGHLQQQELVALVLNPDAADSANKQEHLRQCEICANLFNVLKQTHRFSANISPETKKPDFILNNISNYLSRIFTHELTKQEAANYFDWLKNSPECFEQTFKFVAEYSTPVSEKDEQELSAYRALSIANDVLQAVPPEPPGNFWKNIKKTLEPVGRLLEPVPYPIRLAAPALVAILIAFLVIDFRQAPMQEIHDFAANPPFSYNFQNLPPKYQPSTIFRGTDPVPDNPLIGDRKILSEQFDTALRDYQLKRYLKVVERLEAVLPLAEKLELDAPDSDDIDFLHGFYVILGGSHIGAIAEEREDSRSISTADIGRSIQYLNKARALHENYDLTPIEGEHFFLGLAYAFDAQKEPALLNLEKVETTSRFYEQSQRAIELLNKQ